jgi:HK97 family phage portal protein
MIDSSFRLHPSSFVRGLLARVARRARDLIPGQYYGYSLISPVLSGIIVTPQTALTLTAFWCGVNTLSTDLAKLPLTLNRRTARGGREPLTNDRRNRLLRFRPNNEMNAFRYRQSQMGHALGWGNGLSEIVRDGSGRPIELWPLHPGTTKPMRDVAGKALYYEDINTGKRFLPENVLHIAGLSFDGICGYSPATMGRQAIGLGIAQEQFGAALFGNGARPGGMLRTPKKLSSDAAKRLRETFDNVHAGTLNAHRTAVLEEGLEWVESQISPENAQFLTSRRFQIIEIARLLNMPPNKLMDYSEAHHTNVEEANEDYISTTIQGWCEANEAEYNTKLLFEDEQDDLFFHHDMNALMRGNMQARSAYNESRFRTASITSNQIRMSEGDNPEPPESGLDQYLIQAQYVPIAQAGQAMAKKVADSGEQPPPAKRHNPNHGADGKFAAGSGGHGGGGHDPIARAGDLGRQLADHPDPIPELAKEFPSVADEDWMSEARNEHDELIDEQRDEVKEQAKDQRTEEKEFSREQADETKDLDRDLKDEVKEVDRDHAAEIKDLEREHKADLKDHDKEPAEDPAEHARERQDLQGGHAEDKQALLDDHIEHKQSLKEDHDLKRKDHLEAQADARKEFAQNQADALQELLDEHAAARKEFIIDKAIELFDLEQELVEDDAASSNE